MSVDLTVFVPCLNEAGNVGRTIDRIVRVLAGRPLSFEIVVVDDASTDGSVEEIEESRGRYPGLRLHLIRNPARLGLGHNYFVAARRALGTHFMLVNGDAAEPEEALAAIIDRLGAADMIVPYVGTADTRTWSRRLLSRAFTWLVGLLAGHRLRYYNGPVLHQTGNVRDHGGPASGHGYQAELLCRLLDRGITVVEVPIVNSDRDAGATKAFRPANLLSVAATLGRIGGRRVRRWIAHRFGA